MSSELERYSRQIRFSGLSEEGQRKLLNSRVLICGCGALGTVLAETLTRAGVGYLRIADRDFVELSNLQRQVLFDEEDIASHQPKAIAAAEKLRRINSEITIDPHVVDIDHTTIRPLMEGIDLVLDGTDNFEIRFLINDACLETGTPWVYAGVIGSHGQTMPIFPHESACLRCLIGEIPDAGSAETCETAGVLGQAVNVVSSLSAVTALKLLSGQKELVPLKLMIVDVWEGSLRSMDVSSLRDQSSCPACQGGERLWLSGERGSQSTVLCGRNSVQVAPPHKGELNLPELAERLRTAGEVSLNRYLLRLTLRDEEFEITVFRDGRAIIRGTDELATARTLYSRYIGS